MEKLDVEFELFRKRVYNLEIRSFYLLLLNRGCDIKTLRALFSDVDEKLALKMDGMFYRAQSDIFDNYRLNKGFASYLISPEGVIIAKDPNPEQLTKLIRQ